MQHTILDVEGISVSVVENAFVGAVDGGAVTSQGVSLNGWALSQAGIGQAAPPSRFVLTIDGAVCLTMQPNIDRPDLVKNFGQPIRRCGFSASVPLAAIPFPFVADFKVYAVSNDGRAGLLTFYKPEALVTIPIIRTREDFISCIQNPSTRLKNSQALLFTSIHALTRFPGDFTICAAALCIIGYRLLMKETEDPAVKALFWKEGGRLLVTRPEISEGVYFRWHTSVRLICGYLLYQEGKVDEAIEQFIAIQSLSHLLPQWPTALTNLLLGVFVAGYLLYEKGEISLAKKLWSQGPDVLKRGAAISVFSNIYAFGELENAIKVARECFVGTFVAESGKPVEDVSFGPLGRTVDLRGLGMIAHLVHEKGKVES